jgi:hypothetical protein
MPSSPGRSAQHGGLGNLIKYEFEVRRTDTLRLVPVLRTSICFTIRRPRPPRCALRPGLEGMPGLWPSGKKEIPKYIQKPRQSLFVSISLI